MSKGWRARLRRRLCAPFRAARACGVARDRRDDRQLGLFAAAAPSICAKAPMVVCLDDHRDGCAGRAHCEVLQPWERAAVAKVLRDLERAADEELAKIGLG